MAKAPKRGSDRADEGKTPAAHQADAPPFDLCRSCESPDTCRFELRCDRPRIGRPTVFTDDLADTICERIASGESIVAICRDDDMPAQRTVFRWLADPARSTFRQCYERARETWADAMLEQMLSIADDGSNDTYRDDDGKVRVDHDVIARSKLRVDTLKWAMARTSPKKYGDRIDVTSDGKPLATRSEDELVARFAMLAAPKPDAATES